MWWLHRVLHPSAIIRRRDGLMILRRYRLAAIALAGSLQVVTFGGDSWTMLPNHESFMSRFQV